MTRWRLILDPPMEGRENMAVDEAVLSLFASLSAKGLKPVPTLRLYGWKEPTISIGYAQKSRLFRCLKSPLPVVRRLTGGRAVLHTKELTYSVVASTEDPLFSSGIGAAYFVISSAIVSALKGIGIEASLSRSEGGGGGGGGGGGSTNKEACFHAPSRYEVVAAGARGAGGGKLAGSAQRRFKGVFLQHGSILFDVDEGLNAELFGREVVESMSWVKRLAPAIDIDLLRRLFVISMAEEFSADFKESGLTPPEKLLKERLVREKYSDLDWNENMPLSGTLV